MPASMGMIMLGRLIMQLCGDKDSWDFTSLSMGMMGGMGGGMGGMGGGMGGMGGGMGGMGGGMGGGMRSIPPTGSPHATLNPGQTRSLPTPLVSLSGPTEDLQVALPGKGEKLELGSIDDEDAPPILRAALKRLAQEKAPDTIAQLVVWRLAGVEWQMIGRLSRRWSNPNELALARAFVARLEREHGEIKEVETGSLYVEVATKDSTHKALADELLKALHDAPFGVLGLVVKSGIPARPDGPSVACRINLTGGDDAIVQVQVTDATGTTWVSSGKFSLPMASNENGAVKAAEIGDTMAEGLLSRLVRAQLAKGPKVQGKDTFRIKIDNVSPLILNGIALAGTRSTTKAQPSALAGISLPPRKSMTLPASREVVERLGLKDGIRAVAADLSGL
jgi:hypothetical protein